MRKKAKTKQVKKVKLEINPLKQAISAMYDKLAAKMVVALYREKAKILQKINNKF